MVRFIDVKLQNIRDLPFQTITIDGQVLNSTFWFFARSTVSYLQRMNLDSNHLEDEINDHLAEFSDKSYLEEKDPEIWKKFSE